MKIKVASSEAQWARDRAKLDRKVKDVLHDLSLWCIEEDLVGGELVHLADQLLLHIYAVDYHRGMIEWDDLVGICEALPKRVKRLAAEYEGEEYTGGRKFKGYGPS